MVIIRYSTQNNKDKAEKVCKYKAFKIINDKLQIRVKWSQLNTTEEGKLLL